MSVVPIRQVLYAQHTLVSPIIQPFFPYFFIYFSLALLLWHDSMIFLNILEDRGVDPTVYDEIWAFKASTLRPCMG